MSRVRAKMPKKSQGLLVVVRAFPTTLGVGTIIRFSVDCL